MLRNKKVLMLLSLVIALFLWVYVVAVENPPTERRISNIPINFEHQDELEERGLAVDSEQKPRMEIVISGARSDVMKVDSQDVLATADLTGYGKGHNFAVVSVKVPGKVDIVEQKTQVIPINIEKLKKVNKRVEINIIGSIGKDLEPKVISQDVKEVQISGAASQIAKVYSITADIDSKKIAENGKKHKIKILVKDSKGNKLKGIRLSENYVNAVLGIYAVKQVELELDLKGETQSELQISSMDYPEFIKLKGPAEELEQIEKVVSEPIYLEELKESATLPIILQLPESVEAVDEEMLKLEVKLRGLDSEEFFFEVEGLKLKGLPEGKTVKIEEQKIKVKFTGKSEELSKIDKNNIELYVELEGLEAGEHKVQVEVEKADKLPPLTLEPKELRLTID